MMIAVVFQPAQINAGAAGLTAPQFAEPSSAPSTIVFQRVAEPNENAFTILVPRGWRIEGGIFRLDPSRAGGPANAIAAKLDFAVKSDASRRVVMRWVPEMLYFDPRWSPAGQMGLFPPGSNYQGMTVYPLMSAGDYLRRVVFPRAHPQAGSVQVIEQRALPQLAQAYLQRLRSFPLPMTSSYDAAAITVAYQEGNTRFQERLFAVIENWGQMGTGMWGNKDTFYFRAPVSEFEAAAQIFSVIQNSVKVNSSWLGGELRGQIERGHIALKTQQEIQQIERQMVAHKQQTNAEIQNEMFLNLTGQEEYVNPFTGQVEVDSNQWRHRWINPSGDVVMSNDDNYVPRRDPSLNRQDFKPTPPRRR